MKDRKRRVWLFLTIAVLALIVALTAVVSYAEYTKSSRAKRVIASYESGETLFSSNYMALNTAVEPDDVSNRRLVFAASADVSASAEITVCNYAQGNPARFYSDDITYVLSMKLVAAQNGKWREISSADSVSGKTVTVSYKGVDVTLNAASSSARSHTFASSTLDRRAASRDVCSVHFSSAFNEDDNVIALYVKATPTGAVAHGLPEIDGFLVPTVASAEGAVRWTGWFNEAGALGDSAAALPTELDGFNYVISGNGAASARLKWMTAALVPNQLFTLGKTIQSSGLWSYVDFDVDSDAVSRYDVQFYRVEGTQSSFATWNAVKDYVVFEFTPS